MILNDALLVTRPHQKTFAGEANTMARREIDHSLSLQHRLLDLVNTDTCDVTFIVGPGPGRGDHSQHAEVTPRASPPRASASLSSPKDANLLRSASSPSVKRCAQSRGSTDGVSPAGDGAKDTGAFSDTSRVKDSHSARNQLSPARPYQRLPRPRSHDGHLRTTRIEAIPNEGEGGASGEAPEEMNTGATRNSTSPGGTTTKRSETSARIPCEVREYRCHRVVFASCSEYFRVLLYGQMSESQTRRVELPDIAVEGFETILTYAYSGKAVVTTDNVMEVFALAHRFGMNELLRACADVLDECMNCNDVCRVLEAAEYYDQPELAAKCWELIKESTPRDGSYRTTCLVLPLDDPFLVLLPLRVLKSEGFLEISVQLVKTLVQEGELQVREVDLFAGVQAWVDHNSQERRGHIDKLFPHLRLPLVSLRELMSVVRPSKLIPAEALLDAVAFHSDPDCWKGDAITSELERGEHELKGRPRGKGFTWDVSSLTDGTWSSDDGRTVTTSIADWVGIYGKRIIRSGFHRWSVCARKLGLQDKRTSWKAILGVARPCSQDLARPFLPVTGFVVGTGQSKLGGNTAVDSYAKVALHDGDVVTVLYDADAGSLAFMMNGVSLGEAYSRLSGPVVAALAINSAGASWSLDCEM